MSAQSSKKKNLLLVLLFILVGAIALLSQANKQTSTVSKTRETVEQNSELAATSELTDELLAAEQKVEEPHSVNCAHCASESIQETHAQNGSKPPVLQTQPNLDPIFKRIHRERISFSRSDFDFLTGSYVGQAVDFELAGRQFSGEVAVVREGKKTRAYVVDFPEGVLNVMVNTLGEFKGYFMFEGDSRVVEIAKSKTISEDTNAGVSGELVTTEVSVSDVLCAPPGAVFPLTAPQPSPLAGLPTDDGKEFAPLEGPVAAPVLTAEADSGHVLYLNFEGEVVTGDPWNTNSGISTINAAPAPRSNEVAYVTNIWERVVEDFAPFDITVTTDRALYDATPTEQRLQAIITTTKDVAPFAGGVAFLNSYATDFSDIVWVFNLSEYSCASTISHEAGHAFGLSHDGNESVVYYPGHNDSYEPGWGAIMGAPFIGLEEEVDQWSKGEYVGANNTEDDVAIIANAANGFGYKQDDFADIYTGVGGLSVGLLATTGPQQVGGSGIISRSGDKDVFRFAAAFSGAVSVTVNPIDVESTDLQPGSSTSGANLAVATRLLDASGNPIAIGVDVGDNLLSSRVEGSIEPGIYYLEVDGVGRGSDPSGGFSDYGSLGQYEIVGDLPTQPLSVAGSPPEGKQDVAVLLGDETTSLSNGTDFGYSYPSNGPITHTFILTNNGITDLENVSVSLANGIDFEIVSMPGATIAAGASVFMSVAYDPLESGANGIDGDTVIINYETTEPVYFEFGISGLSTPSAIKDNYEDNNVLNQATDLNAVENVWLSDYKGKAFFLSYPDDFYTFNVENGDLVTIDVSYDATEGPITFELVNSQNVLLGSTSAEDGSIKFLVPGNYTSLHKPFYVKASISGDNSVRSPYDLRWSSASSGSSDDFYEENDTRDEAFDLTGAFDSRLSNYLGVGILNDEDWYKIVVPRDPFVRLLYVRADFVHADGDINIEIFPENEGSSSEYLYGLAGEDEDYEVLTYFQNTSTPDFAEKFTEGNQNIMGLEPGTYYIRVTGDYDRGNEYDLIVETKQDDNYEIVNEVDQIEDDTAANASDLGDAVIGNWLSTVDGIGVVAAYAPTASAEDFQNLEDRDWYRFTIPDDASAEEILIDFDNIIAETRVFSIYDANIQLLTHSNSSDIEVLEESVAGGTFRVSNLPGKTFYIGVVSEGIGATLAPYDFRVRLSTLPPEVEEIVDDNYEENDNFTVPFNISDNSGFWLTAVDGYGIQFDPDWYQITVPEGAAQLTIQCVFDSSLGDINLTLSRKDGPTLFSAPYPPGLETSEEPEPLAVNSKSIVWEAPEPGQYAVTITGDNRGNYYNLFWGYDLLEDAYEENDVRAEATDLTSHEKQLLSKLDGPGIQADEDWYRVSVGADTDQLRIISTFNDSEGDIDMELYNSAGYLVARSTSVTNDETITLSSPAVGDYFVRIYYENASNQYDLWWGSFTQEELDAIETDAYEVDNSSASAAILPARTSLVDLDGLATQTDEDWWAIEIPESNSGFLIDCTFTHAEGDIDLEVVDSYGAVVVRADSQFDNESVNFNAYLPGGTYYIRVYGANLGNAYDLYWVDYREDAFEENDSFETAADITDLRQLRLSETDVPTQGDDDWYLVTAEQANSILVMELTYTAVDGSIFYEIYDSSENLLTSDLTDEEVKYLQYALPTSGQFYIRVFGDNAYNEYDLFWNALPEDVFEENDIRDDARDISSDASIDLEGVIFDDDWFVLDPPYGVVAVELALSYDATFGQIDLTVINQFGEPVFVFPSDTNINAVAFEVDPFDGVTYIQLTGADGNYGNPYTLNWIPVTRDVDEDNDTLATATDISFLEGIPLSERGGYDTSADEDWFFLVPSGTNLNVYCRFEHAAGDIDVELFDQNGAPVERAISDTDDELIIASVISGDTYYIRVFGETAGNPYDLVWNSYDSDDGYEENDVALAAADLLSVEYELQENLVQLDDDWYAIEVEAGDDLLIAEIDPLARVDAMVLELYDAGGVRVDSVATAEGDTLIEANSLVAGTYYLRVSGKNLGGRYALIWSSGSEDNYEENDADLDARDLSANPATQISAIDGFGAQYDEDWFHVTLTSDDSNFFAQLDFVHNEGDLSLALLDGTGAELALSDDATDTESFIVNGLGAGDYFLRVLGPNLGSVYDLFWSAYAEDNYEDNDTFVQSYDLGSSVSGILSPIDGLGVRGSDDDYFALSVPNGYVTLDVTCTFTHADGDIAIELFDGGKSSLASSDTGDDDESVSVPVDPTGDIIYILVSGAEDTGATYDLTWTFGSEDLYEDNDTSGAATDISAQENSLLSESMGYATQSDSDFYLVTIPAYSRTLNVDVLFEHSLGNIAVNVYDSVPTLIATVDSTTDNETLSLDVDVAGGDYYIEVTGTNSGNYYDLIWSVDVDDAYEENDNSSATSDITALNGVSISADLGLGMQYDEDWYSFATPAGDIVLNILIDGITLIEGNIDLELYDASDNLVASSTNGETSEEILISVDPSGESFKVRVFGDNNGNSYDLTWSTSKVDQYEENDFVEDYYDLTDAEGVWLSDVNGLGTQADDDWYQIVVSTGATMLTINCTFTHADGDIDMELYRLDPTAEGEKTAPSIDQRKPTLVDRRISTDDNEQIIYDTTGQPGIYFIRVYFGNEGNLYDLLWEDALVDPAGDSDFLGEDWFFSDNGSTLGDSRLLTPLANVDGDAFPNWTEYALDLDVGVADTVIIDNSKQVINGKHYFTISFIRNAEAAVRGYKFYVDESSDLSFEGSHLAILDSMESLGDGLERVTYRCTKAMSESKHCFFRIRVEAPEKGY